MNLNFYTSSSISKFKPGFKTIPKILLIALLLAYSTPLFSQTIPATPTAVSASPSAICQGNSTTLRATSVGNTIRWYASANSVVTIGISNSGAGFSVAPSTVTTYYAQAVSPTGDTSALRGSVTVPVNTVPTITSTPPDVNTLNAPGQCGSVVIYPSATASGTPTPTLLYSNKSGTKFESGTTTVLITAVNVCGNSSLSFDVTVVDNEPPVVISPPDTTLIVPSGSSSVSNVTLTPPVVSDNCGVLNITNDAPATFLAGTTIVTWTATDNNGNSASTTQAVHVPVTNTPPVVSGITTNDADNTIAQNSAITLNINWSDEATGGPYTVNIDWRDSSAHTVLSGISGHSASPSHTYKKTGVFAPVVIITDGGNLSDTSIFQFVVVYVVGNYSTTADGNFTAPAGSLVSTPTLTPSHSNVAFGDQCQPSGCRPGVFNGNVELNMGYCHFDFETECVDWDYLAVSACYIAQFEGSGYMYPNGHKKGCCGNCHGKCNPSSYQYGILVVQTDKFNGGANGNKIRVKIWNKTTGAIIFDTQMGDADNAMPTTAFNGCIKVCVPKSCVARMEAAELPSGTFETAVYPNPFQAVFNINVKTASTSNIEFGIYDVVGRLVQNLTDILPNQPLTIQNNLPDGLYFIHVKQDNNSQIIKMIKNE